VTNPGRKERTCDWFNFYAQLIRPFDHEPYQDQRCLSNVLSRQIR
jgi:hypothetical protein